MSWQVVFSAPDAGAEMPPDVDFQDFAPPESAPRKPVSMTVQLDSGTVVVDADEDED
jgi:hypothetical protein